MPNKSIRLLTDSRTGREIHFMQVNFTPRPAFSIWKFLLFHTIFTLLIEVRSYEDLAASVSYLKEHHLHPFDEMP